MGMKGTLMRAPAAAVAGLLLWSGPAGGLPGTAAGTTRHAPAVTGRTAAGRTAAGRTAAGPAVPSSGIASSLQDVACTSVRNCWAVGSYETASSELNDALHWNGTSWSKVATPDHGTGPGRHSSLTAVTCTSARNCWAVGSYDRGTTQLNQALHWDGGSWSKVATPDPGIPGSGAHVLYGVSCASRADCWAVGSHISGGGIGRNAVLRWNGASWSAVSVPDPGTNAAADGRELSGVACTSASDCVAIGGYGDMAGTERNEALRWNGTSWLRLASRQAGELSSLACTDAVSCWAVRGQASGKGAIRWNGLRWSAVATPGRAELNGVACAAAASCVAVGNHDSAGAVLNDVLRWNGISWSAVPVPDPGGTGAGAQNRLAAVACPSAVSCWAVGSYWDRHATAHRDVALHWNGHAWSGQEE
jgi:hypothetical protein